jgi:hypothetical protein
LCSPKYAPCSLYIPSGENQKYVYVLIRQFLRCLLSGTLGCIPEVYKNSEVIRIIHVTTGLNLTHDNITNNRRRAPVKNSVPLTTETAAVFVMLRKNFSSSLGIKSDLLFTKDTYPQNKDILDRAEDSLK